MKHTFTDDVNGVLVGGDYGQCWVTYQGRKQGSTGYPSNEVEADNFCQAIIDQIKAECGSVFIDIYPDKSGWKFHFDGV
jgi:hypothetical protein